MENLAFLYASEAFEDPSEEPRLRSLEELGLTSSNPFVMGAAGLAVGAVVLANPADAQAVVGFGDRGPSVIDVQSRLIDFGYDPGFVDGVFGANTEDAVVAFQRDYGLSADGVVGCNTATTMGLPGGGFGCGGGGTPPSDGFITVSTNGSPLTVRSGPGTGFASIDALSNGAVIGYTDFVNGWYEIDGGGWVSSSWVVEGAIGGGGDGDGGMDGGPDTVTVVTNGGTLAVRTGPGTGFGIISELFNGETVSVVGSSGSWYEIAGGGWISSAWTAEGGGIGGGGGGGGGVGTLVVSTNGGELVARTGPGLGYAVAGGYSNGAVVDFFDYYAGWYETSAGWVSADWVYEI